MKKFKQFLCDLHLYKGKTEYLTKLLIWLACWIIGILVARCQNDNIGSAYCVFALALLMEFAFQIEEKSIMASRILHTLFCFAMVVILMLSVLSVFLPQYNAMCEKPMFLLSICIMVYMTIDWLILWTSDKESDQENTEQDIAIDEAERIIIEKFIENLNRGNLGNLKNKR